MMQAPGFSQGENLLTIPQVAQDLRICRAQVYKLMNTTTDDRLLCVHIGRSVRIVRSTLEEWIRKHEQECRSSMAQRERYMEF